MHLQHLLAPERVIADVKASGKKQLVRILAQIAARTLPVDEDHVFNAITAREQLGSTGVGEGVALPHAEVPGIEGVTGIFVRMEKPVAYASVDDAPVDLVFVLLAGCGAQALQLRALASVSRLLRKSELRERLRAAPDAEGIYSLIGNMEIHLP